MNSPGNINEHHFFCLISFYFCCLVFYFPSEISSYTELVKINSMEIQTIQFPLSVSDIRPLSLKLNSKRVIFVKQNLAKASFNRYNPIRTGPVTTNRRKTIPQQNHRLPAKGPCMAQIYLHVE